MRNTGLKEAQAGIKIAGEISITSDMQMTPPLWQKVKRNLMKVKVESEKVSLKLNIQKMKIMASGSHHFMGNRWGNSGNSVRLYFWGAPKSLQMVIAAMKLKDAYSLEEKL